MEPASETRFYLAGQPHGELSNFSRHQIMVDGESWATVEHFYQAAKFIDDGPSAAVRAMVREAPTPLKATKIAHASRYRELIRADWTTIKEAVMLMGLRAKFSQNPEAASALLGTGESRLVEHTTLDHYWADGGDGTGLNRLGKLLEEVRRELRAAQDEALRVDRPSCPSSRPEPRKA